MSNAVAGVASVEEDGYADAYDDDDEQVTPMSTARQNSTSRSHNEEEDDDNNDDGAELAEMFAKVQTLQQAEGRVVKPTQVKQLVDRGEPFEKLEVSISDRANAGRRRSTSPPSATSSRTASPAGPRVAVTRSADGITTISRKEIASGKAGIAHINVLSGVKKPALFQDRLLQTAKQQPHALKQLKQKVVTAAPAVIAKRIEALSEPKRNDPDRQFAQDDEQRHCRFRTKKKTNGSGGRRDAFEDDDASGHDRTSDFLARMEATERNRQKKLDLTRGETDYLANLNKKVCPKCDVPQSYSEYRDKKKRCQTCGSEFRVPQAWGDVGADFITRISEDSRTRDERRQHIRSQVIQEEVTRGRVTKSATQQFYEMSLQQRNEHKTFLNRNYSATAQTGATTSTSTSTAKTKQAQLQLQMQLQAQRAKLLAAAQPPIY